MRVIYVDDEKIQLENFRLCLKDNPAVESLELFRRSEEACAWVEEHPVDVAFLDIEMPCINGIELARRIKEIDSRIRIVFVTAYEQYALEAFGVRAVGYLLKPYTKADIEKELKNAGSTTHGTMKKEIRITTMPDFLVTVNGKNIFPGHSKQEELFALLVDRGKIGITKGEAIACLWEGRTTSDSTYWTCLYRLKNLLEKEGVSELLVTNGNTKSINTDMVDCDLYRMLEGDRETIDHYTGRYLRRFEWAEERIPQLNNIKDKMRQ